MMMIAVINGLAVEYGSARFVRELVDAPLRVIQMLEPAPLWLSIFIILMILTVALVIFVGLRLINQRRDRLGQSRYRLQVINKGNLAAHYLLRAQESGGVLTFSFLVNGVELKQPAQPAVKQPEAPLVAQQSPVKPRAATEPQPARPLPRSNFMKRTSQFRQASGPLARILSGLSFLLPNSARMGMYQSTARFRGAQYKVQQADNLTRQVGGFSFRGQKAAAPGSTKRTEKKPVVASTGQPSSRKLDTTEAPAKTERPGGPQWVTTPAMAPGENLNVELLITPRNPRLSQEYTFKILSRNAEWEDSPESIESCSLQMKGISWFNYLWPYAALAMSLLVVLAVFTVLIRAYVLG